jgi:hypothetical protein
MSTRIGSLAVVATALFSWTMGGLSASAQLISSFENDLSSSFDTNWTFDMATNFGPTGATEGSSALAITHPGNWSISGYLKAGLPLAQVTANSQFLVLDATTTDIGIGGDGASPSWREVVVIFNSNQGGWQQTGLTLPVASDDGGSHTETLIVDLVSSGIQANAATYVASGGGDGTWWELFIALQGGDQGIQAGNYAPDSSVNAADYTVWRDTLGGTTLTNETVSPGIVDQEDYDEWKAKFGTSYALTTIIDNVRFANAGSGGLAAAGVPEPTSGLLGLIAASAVAVMRRVRR